MRAQVLHICRFAGIDIARDIEVIVVRGVRDFCHWYHARVARFLFLLVEHRHDFVNILGAQSVLVAILKEAVARINHEDAVAGARVRLINDKDAGRDTGAIEQIGRQPDDALDKPPRDKSPADVCFPIAAK